MRIAVITIFPQLFEPFLAESFPAIAAREGLVAFEVHNPRDWTTDRHRSVDDAPYGGGAGMVMRPEPLVAAIEAVSGRAAAGPGRPRTPGDARVVALSPQGRPLSQPLLEEFAQEAALVLVCGRYEGIDQRVLDLAVDDEVSLGDYVLSGGEVPAMALIEGVIRLVPGVLGNPESLRTESFREDLLEGPHYTRPPDFRGLEVPAVLLSGDHAAIAAWRVEQARDRTAKRRPDLLAGEGAESSESSDTGGDGPGGPHGSDGPDGANRSGNRSGAGSRSS